MLGTSWLHSLKGRRPRKAPVLRRGFVPRLETLEGRIVLSTVAHFLDLSTPAGGVFPSNIFTLEDPDNLTGRQVKLPLPDEITNPSDFQDIQVINTLDGFNLQPRLSIPFDGPIDPGVSSVNSQNVFLINLGDTTDPDDRGGQIVGINQVVWDTFTNTLHVESDELLDQHTRYALIVTNGVLDADGEPVQASEEFTRFRHDLNFGQTNDPALKAYRKDLLDAMEAAALVGVPETSIVTASVFTTQSATAVLEKIRDQIHAAPPPAADFNIGPGGARTVFNLSDVTGIKFHQQVRVNPPAFTDLPVPIQQLRIFPGVVAQVAYAKYSSPDYEVHPGEYIPAVGTRTGTPAVQAYNDIYFTLYLPSGTQPAGGWPVAIWGHGSPGSKDATLSGVAVIAATMAANGIATIGITGVGHGFGPLGTLEVTQSGGGSVTLLAGGRGIDQNGDDVIGNTEGFEATPPRTIIRQRDARIQTAADLVQLVRVIEAGVDVHGDGSRDLDPSQVYYVGASFGSMYGAPFLAVEPSVRAGVLNTVGGSAIEVNRLRAGRGDLATEMNLAGRGLLNAPGIISVDGLTVRAPFFNENMPLREGASLTAGLMDGTTQVIQSPVTNTVAGATAIQQVFENWEWVSQPGNPVAYAPHLRKDPLSGVPAKSVIIQFAKGDQNVENPTTTAFLRAGDLADVATYYRYDLAYAESQQNMLPLPPPNFLYPHTFAGLIINPNNLIVQDVARGAQEQIAEFFATGVIVHPTPERFFETPIQGPLPEGLNYVIAAPPLAPVGAAMEASGGSNDVSILLGDDVWDGGGSIKVRLPELPGHLLWLALGATTIPHARAVHRFSATPLDDRAMTTPAEQDQRIRGVSDKRKDVTDEVLTVGMRPRRSAGFDLCDVAVIDQVFADSEWGLAAPFGERPSL